MSLGFKRLRIISEFTGRLKKTNETGVKMAGRRNLWIHIDIWRAIWQG